MSSVLCKLQSQVNAIQQCLDGLKGLPAALSDIQDQIDNLVDSDNQVIALSGNTLTLSGGAVPDSSVDLSQYLDDTDEQTITQFAVVGGSVVLTIEDGNTVTVPLSDFQDGTGTDDQTLSLIGDNLTIEDGNTIDLSQFEETLTTTDRVIWSEEYFASSVNGTTQSANRNLTIVRTAVGQWSATLNGDHESGTNYHVSFTAEEQSANRDTPDITIVQGSKTNSSFDFQITTGDNGASADGYVDTPFTVGINCPVTVLTGATIV